MTNVTKLRAKMPYLGGDPLDQNQSQTPDQCHSHLLDQPKPTAYSLSAASEQQQGRLKESGE